MPAEEKHSRRRNSIHRALVTRLLLASVVVALVLIAIVLFVQFRNFETSTVEQALVHTENFRASIMDKLDAPALGDHQAIQRAMDKLASLKRGTSYGRFVYVRVTGLEGNLVAAMTDPAYPYMQSITDYMARDRDLAELWKQGGWNKTLRMGDGVVLDMGYTLRNSSEVPVAYVEGIYAISPLLRSRAYRSAVFTALMVAGVVFLTSMILYPSINSLLRRVSGLSANLLHANMEILTVLGSAIAKRDCDTDIHNYRVTIYAVRLAEELKLPEDEIRTLIKGAFLHDVGKIGIRDSILLKSTGLSPEEFREMKLHVKHGLDIVSGSVWLRDAALVVGGHHERFDGSGYLEMRADDEIPRAARVFTVADVFDALSSQRPYKEAFSLEKTMEILVAGAGAHFDPEVLDAFKKIAPALYRTYANRDDEKPRGDLREIIRRYFSSESIGEISLRAGGASGPAS